MIEVKLNFRTSPITYAREKNMNLFRFEDYHLALYKGTKLLVIQVLYYCEGFCRCRCLSLAPSEQTN